MIDWLQRCSEDTGAAITTLRRDKFVGWCMDADGDASGRPTHADIRSYGGGDGEGAWQRLLAATADETGSYPEPSRAALGKARELQIAVAHRKKLERLIGDEEYYTERLRSAFRDAVAASPSTISRLYKPKIDMDRPAKREIVVHVSDVHIGLSVDRREVPLGRYDYQTAARRLAYLCNQVADYEHGPDVALRVVLAGDIIDGVIHTDDRGIDMLSSQCDAARQILVSMLDFWRHHFSKVYVEATTGNHDRRVERDKGGRPTAQKYDSHATMIYRAVEEIFRRVPDIRFNIPLTPYNVWESCGHKYFSTHGDSVFEIGAPWKGINPERLCAQLWKIEATVGRVDCVAIGHHHWAQRCPIPGRHPNGCLMINGSSVGSSAFAQTRNLPHVDPQQCFWEATERFIVGNHRISDLWLADDDPRFDSIVPTPVPIGTELPKIAA
jgi:hypothetical protein